MSAAPTIEAQTGQTRPAPSSGPSSPVGKKARLEELPQPEPGPSNSAANPKKSHKKLARKARKKGQHIAPEPYSNEDVLWHDVESVLGKDVVDAALEAGTEYEAPFEFREEVEVEVHSLSSNGDGLALAAAPRQHWVVIVPHALPGEKVRARIYRSSRLHSVADLVSVDVPNPEMRDMNRVKCKYFGKCAGCQYQMLSYDTQLDLKRTVVVKAYQNFSDIPEAAMPPVLGTIASPLQYNYRTKITPHFEAPPKKAQKAGRPAEEAETSQPDWLKIGFNQVGKRITMDIEDCPIATPVLTQAYGPMRENIIKNIYSYKKGVSLLLRDSIDMTTPDTSVATEEPHVCITDHRATVRERVGDMLFEYTGGSFFQNNNSVLVPLTDYVRDAIISPLSPGTSQSPPTHLVDAYCGAGLFAIMLSPHFSTIAGIELSSDSIASATRNATLNHIPATKCTFRAGDAAAIFAAVPDFPPSETALIIDPPRKGSDENFIDQLVSFGARTVVYVSCNVHTQARDVGMILRKSEERAGQDGQRYKLESIRGFDLFPQTAHVESVAVLRLA
ncbi:hypothetical protein HWV62_26078 [Athelia sp. TMB]|nr:hypothetical protein HWV62_26078 [Athelia sp. TMB]